ncbi:MAG: peptidase U32 [Tenericutes bacterium HGW-Tenericutes-4]|nr:MAG: peptidase U32 [Tenericutes bacterium HGW-Tenericutes-4]
MKKFELLAPAGDKEKLETAILYGADAVYFAGKRFGLRAYAGNFDNEGLKDQIEYVHKLGKKAYITLNILAHNMDFNGLREYVEYLQEIKVDAVIVADLGIAGFVKQYAPKLDLHISTQANITNKYSAKAFVDMGAKRLILARELSLPEIKEIADYVGKDIEIETFVHGAMCMAYSGRCMLSHYLTGRDANRGACAQPCRWEYTVTEKSRKGEQFEVVEDERGTYIFNSKDLNVIEHLHELAKVGVTSFKIEGRMKSEYYVATVVNAYRRAIDLLEQDQTNYKVPQQLLAELNKASHRDYTTGFYLGNEEKTRQNTDTSAPEATHKFIAYVLEDAKDGYALIEQRNKFIMGDTLEVLSPNETFGSTLTVEEMLNEEKERVEIANQVQQKLYIKTNLPLKLGDMLRKEV